MDFVDFLILFLDSLKPTNLPEQGWLKLREKQVREQAECESGKNFPLLYNNKQSIYISCQKRAKMDYSLNEGQVGKFVLCQETRSAETEKLISAIEQFNPVEIKLQKSVDWNGKFQTKSLVLTETRPSIDLPIAKIETEHVSAKKFKVELKEKKPKKLTQFQEIFKSYHTFLAQTPIPRTPTHIFTYCRRRITENGQNKQNKIDLGVFNLREIVELCFQKKLVSIQVYAQYSIDDNFINEDNFINKLNHRKYEDLNLTKMYFNVFDHRILATVLVTLFPEEFLFPSALQLENRKLTDFYTFLYGISEQEYTALYENLNSKLNRSWMPTDLEEFRQQAVEKLEKLSRERQEQGYPFHMPPRKLRKKY